MVEPLLHLVTTAGWRRILATGAIEPAQRPAYLRALAGLAGNGTIEERPS